MHSAVVADEQPHLVHKALDERNGIVAEVLEIGGPHSSDDAPAHDDVDAVVLVQALINRNENGGSHITPKDSLHGLPHVAI